MPTGWERGRKGLVEDRSPEEEGKVKNMDIAEELCLPRANRESP